jgi:FkbM family methyltransferase
MGERNPTQDELVWAYFGQRAEGVFVEVGANQPRDGSQTWLLEQKGWRGILVEPQERLCRELCQQRPRSQVFRAACSAPEKAGVGELHIPDDSLNGFATLERNVDDFDIRYTRTERVEIVTLDSLLAKAGYRSVDFISIDTEGTELDVLRGFSLATYKPALILLEDKCQSLDKHRFLRGQGYKLVKRTELPPRLTRVIWHPTSASLSLPTTPHPASGSAWNPCWRRRGRGSKSSCWITSAPTTR